MKYTFLMPSYKAKYFKAALDSILAQTYTDYQVIISDDNSPENLDKLVEEYSSNKNFPKIKYIKGKNNIGGKDLVLHWNKILNYCNSEYIIMASDDDIYHPNFLEKIDELSIKYPEVDVLRARTMRIDLNGNPTSKEDIFDEKQTGIEAIHSIFCGNYIGCIGNYVFKTSSIQEAGGFIYMPYAWFSDLLTVANHIISKGQTNTKDILFQFRISNQNISNIKHNKEVEKEKLLATIKTDQWLSSFFETIKVNDSFEDRLKNDSITAYKHRIYGQCGDYSWAIPFYKWVKIYKQLKQNKYFSAKSFFKYFSLSIINRTF